MTLGPGFECRKWRVRQADSAGNQDTLFFFYLIFRLDRGRSHSDGPKIRFFFHCLGSSGLVSPPGGRSNQNKQLLFSSKGVLKPAEGEGGVIGLRARNPLLLLHSDRASSFKRKKLLSPKGFFLTLRSIHFSWPWKMVEILIAHLMFLGNIYAAVHLRCDFYLRPFGQTCISLLSQKPRNLNTPMSPKRWHAHILLCPLAIVCQTKLYLKMCTRDCARAMRRISQVRRDWFSIAPVPRKIRDFCRTSKKHMVIKEYSGSARGPFPSSPK